MAAQWSNWEDSRQHPVGHPTLPLRYISNFHDCCRNLLQQQDMIPPWPQHGNLMGCKDSGVVPSSMRNLEMYNSYCCCYLNGPCPCPVAAAGTKEIPPRSIAAGQHIPPLQRCNCPPQQLQNIIVSNSCWVLPLLLVRHCCCCCCCGVVQCPKYPLMTSLCPCH